MLLFVLLLFTDEGLIGDLLLALTLCGDSAWAEDEAMLCSLVVDNESIAESMLIETHNVCKMSVGMLFFCFIYLFNGMLSK